MIIDYISNDPYEPPIIYERTRGSDGVLHERYITHEDDDFVYPFCWVKQGAPTYVLNRLERLNARVLKDEVSFALNGGKVWKVQVNHPNQLWEIKDMVGAQIVTGKQKG